MAGIEWLKQEEKLELTQDQKNFKEFENEDKKRNGSILNGFGKMLNNFIEGKNLNEDTRKKTEQWKKEALASAANVLNDDTLNASGKRARLEKLFGTFKENTEYFPQNQDNTQQQKSDKEKSEDFLKSLMTTIDENRKTDQERNQNFANKLANETAAPANGWPWHPPNPQENPVFSV